MQPQLGIRKRFLEVYWGWTDSASAGDQEEVFRSLLRVGRCSLSWASGRGLLEVPSPSVTEDLGMRLVYTIHVQVYIMTKLYDKSLMSIIPSVFSYMMHFFQFWLREVSYGTVNCITQCIRSHSLT